MRIFLDIVGAVGLLLLQVSYLTGSTLLEIELGLTFFCLLSFLLIVRWVDPVREEIQLLYITVLINQMEFHKRLASLILQKIIKVKHALIFRNAKIVVWINVPLLANIRFGEY